GAAGSRWKVDQSRNSPIGRDRDMLKQLLVGLHRVPSRWLLVGYSGQYERPRKADGAASGTYVHRTSSRLQVRCRREEVGIRSANGSYVTGVGGARAVY